VHIAKERQGRALIDNQLNLGECRNFIRMGIDSLARGLDGMEGGLLGYGLEQIARASYYLSEAAFRLQTQILVEAKDYETANDKKGRQPCQQHQHAETKPEISASALETRIKSGKARGMSDASAGCVEKSSKCPTDNPATPTDGGD